MPKGKKKKGYKGIGIVEVLIVGGLVAGGAMVMKHLSDVKKSGKQEAVLEQHEALMDQRKAVSGQLKDHQLHQRKMDLEEDRMMKEGATERELNEKAFERFGRSRQ